MPTELRGQVGTFLRYQCDLVIWFFLCWCCVLMQVNMIVCAIWCYSQCLSKPSELEKYARPRWESNLSTFGSVPTVARHIFQARPVWIYTQSNITNNHIHLSTQLTNTGKIILLEITCMKKPSPYWQNIIFSEYEELKVVVMVTR